MLGLYAWYSNLIYIQIKKKLLENYITHYFLI